MQHLNFFLRIRLFRKGMIILKKVTDNLVIITIHEQNSVDATLLR